MKDPNSPQEAPDISRVMGGPLYRLFTGPRFRGSPVRVLRQRILLAVSITWLPLLILCVMGGHFLQGQGLSFLADVETQVRFLIAVPLLIIAEMVVHQRSRSVVNLFPERGVVTAEDTPKFYAALENTMKWRNSIFLEIALVVFVFTVGHWSWAKGVAFGAASWYASPDGTNLHLTPAGYWYEFVGIPSFQFLLFRWYVRLAFWFCFLWRVSRLNLRLVPTHPDRAGGISFLGENSYAFAPVLFAQAAVLAGVIANRVLYQGQQLKSFTMTIVALAVFFVLIVLVPTCVFVPNLFRARFRGLDDYGTMSTSYVTDFDKKWIHGGAEKEGILGTADLQSLADLANSLAVVQQMRIVPFSINDVGLLVAATTLPLLPLLLTVMPIDELVRRLFNIIF
jgi:hypothetical protein